MDTGLSQTLEDGTLEVAHQGEPRTNNKQEKPSTKTECEVPDSVVKTIEHKSKQRREKQVPQKTQNTQKTKVDFPSLVPCPQGPA